MVVVVVVSADTTADRCIIVLLLLLLLNLLVDAQPLAVEKGVDFTKERMHLPDAGPFLGEGDHVAGHDGDGRAVARLVVGSQRR